MSPGLGYSCIRFRFASIVVALVALIALFGGPSASLRSPAPAQASVICVEPGSVNYSSVTWDNTCIHLVTSFFMAGGTTLTINPGTIVKMRQPIGPLDTNIILDGAHLIANGTSANPIIITSWHDDAAGSDDTDGMSQAPARATGRTSW